LGLEGAFEQAGQNGDHKLELFGGFRAGEAHFDGQNGDVDEAEVPFEGL
jgi:hypothetical protein